MLRLLLDANISPVVAREVQSHRPDCLVTTLRDWQDGRYLNEPDDGVILQHASEQQLTLLTRDVRTILPLTVEWATHARSHAGVIFVDDRTIAEKDVGGLVQAIVQLWGEAHEAEWEDRVEFLRRP